mmetsp:Transcript_1593/g.1408  ORF Transcript_1593/g.1408 Transcript_1593/m.1408 type:complete len:82 (-) Transcript_1593:195-440(-)
METESCESCSEDVQCSFLESKGGCSLSGVCVECAQDSNCQFDEDLQRCNVEANECVQCAEESHCEEFGEFGEPFHCNLDVH